jgi:hypothetical protein
MEDEIDRDNERHRREELERRAKRHKARDEKASSGAAALGEKERKRKEHAARILAAQRGSSGGKPKLPPPSSSSSRRSKHGAPSSTSSSAAAAAAAGGSSIFQSLFAERALGFSISFAFRNAPPRPPVGPIFVGLGLEGELQKWTRYKKSGSGAATGVGVGGVGAGGMGAGSGGGGGMNAVEKNYHWKLHSDLLLFNGSLHRQILPGCAMDYEGCYLSVDGKNATAATTAAAGSGGVGGGEGKSSSTTLGTSTTASANPVAKAATTVLPPEDEALINWKGSLGDTAMEVLTTKQDRARAAARLAISQGKSTLFPTAASVVVGGAAAAAAGGGGIGGSNVGTSSSTFRLKKHHLQSRILDEKTPNFMKKTTYLTNDTTSVHRFTSLASTQVQRAKDMDIALKEKRDKYNIGEMIEKGFREANNDNTDNATAAGNNKRRKRVHPITKQEVHAVWDVPLLPDVSTWGHTFTHVVMDNPPRNIGATTTTTASNKKRSATARAAAAAGAFKIPQLNKAIVADVTKHASNARMECTVWVPSTTTTTTTKTTADGKPVATATDANADGKSATTPTLYSALQKYDLDVIPLRDPSLPPVHHVWTIYLNNDDEKKSYAGYHSIGSRVQLSLGRPVIVGGAGGGGGGGGGAMGKGAAITTQKVSHRSLKEREKKDLEMKMTLVDVDLAEKYGL